MASYTGHIIIKKTDNLSDKRQRIVPFRKPKLPHKEIVIPILIDYIKGKKIKQICIDYSLSYWVIKRFLNTVIAKEFKTN
jgi:hypothetical protein